MSFEGDFRSFALGKAAVAAALPRGLFRPRLLKQTSYPCGVFRVISESVLGDHDMAGDDLSSRRVQVDLYAESAAEAMTAQISLKAALNGASGTQGQTVFCEITWESSTELYEEALNLYRWSVDLMVMSRPL